MDIHTGVAFVAACLIFSSIPGIGILFTVNNAIAKSAKLTAVSILGLEISLFLYLCLVGLGLGALVKTSTVLFNTIKWLGVIYLVWLGIQKIINANQHMINSIDQDVTDYKNALVTGILVNLSNPKAIIFLAALLPQFIDPAASLFRQYVILGATMIVIDTIFHTLYGCFASGMRRFIAENRHMVTLNRFFGGVFIGVGLLMAKANR